MGVAPLTPVQNKIKSLLKKLTNESFSTEEVSSTAEARQKLAVVVGVNQIRSIDERANVVFRDAIKTFVSKTEVPNRVAGFFWDPHWEPKSDGAKIFSKEKSYLFVRYLGEGRVDQLREQLEGQGTINTALRSQIPYSTIREKIKASDSTMEFAKGMKNQNSPVYFMTMDDDPVRLYDSETKKGSLSLYEEAIEKTHKEKGFLPSVISLGYQLSLSSGALPIPRLSVQCDMKVREAMNRIIPGSAYMPEPCTAYYLSDSGKLVDNLRKFSFSDKSKGLESRRAVSNGIKSGILQEDRIVFLAISSLVTTMPERMEEGSSTCRKYKNLSPADIKKTEVLNALRGVSQVHFSPLDWAHNLYIALPEEVKKDNGPGIFGKLSGILSKVFNAFDPITFALHKTMTFDIAFAMYEQAIEALVKPQGIQGDRNLRNHKDFLERQLGILNRAKEDLQNLNMSPAWVQRVVLAAKASGKALFHELNAFAREKR